MLLAGYPVMIGIEAPVVRGRNFVESSAALEVRDGIRAAARVVVSAEIANAMGIALVDARAVRPPGGPGGRSRTGAGPKDG
jgi:hypothetical protein